MKYLVSLLVLAVTSWYLAPVVKLGLQVRADLNSVLYQASQTGR